MVIASGNFILFRFFLLTFHRLWGWCLMLLFFVYFWISSKKKKKETCSQPVGIYVQSRTHSEELRCVWSNVADRNRENELFGFGASQINSVLFYSVHSSASTLVASRGPQLNVCVCVSCYIYILFLSSFSISCVSFTRSSFFFICSFGFFSFFFFLVSLLLDALQWDHSKCVLANSARSHQLPLLTHCRCRCSGVFVPAIVGK